MRDAVIRRVKSRAASSSSIVYSRAFPIRVGDQLSSLRLKQRLSRLDFRQVTRTPKKPKEYQVSDSSVKLYLPEFEIPSLHEQKEQLLTLQLNSAGKITNIIDTKFNQKLRELLLPPEVLSLLGQNATRAVTPKLLPEFGKLLPAAVLAIEDERFYSHLGIDFFAVARAIVANLEKGRIVQGASTITQQLAKNLFLESKRTYGRKIIEAVSAILIETAFTKDEILEFYLNEVFLGQEGNVAVHGFGEASRTFYQKDVADLSLAQAATLAGLVKAPTSYSPRRHPAAAKKRRNVVLSRMQELGKISKQEFDQARAKKVEVQAAGRSRKIAPYFIDYLRRELDDRLDWRALSSSNARLYSSLDTEYQACAENAVDEELQALEKAYPRLKKGSQSLQAALISLAPESGEVRAWVGGRDFGRNQFDRVSLAKRQPGSTFKPFVYLTALDKNLNNYRVAKTTSILADQPLELKVPGSGTWSPQNYDKKFGGDITVRMALARSRNVPTVNMALKVGIDSVADTAALFGFGDDLPRVPSLALGAGEVSPLELAQAYATIANGGISTVPRPYLVVTDGEQNEAILEIPRQQRRIASEPATFVLTDMLRSVVEYGTGRGVRRRGFTLPAAGKTGTSNDTRDAWFAGFTPELLAVVWVGFDEGRSLGLGGSAAALPIWTNYMACASSLEPKRDFRTPSGVVHRTVDLRTGLLATPACPAEHVVTEVFVSGTEPLRNSPCGTGRALEFQEDENPLGRVPPIRRRKDPLTRFFENLFGSGR